MVPPISVYCNQGRCIGTARAFFLRKYLTAPFWPNIACSQFRIFGSPISTCTTERISTSYARTQFIQRERGIEIDLPRAKWGRTEMRHRSYRREGERGEERGRERGNSCMGRKLRFVWWQQQHNLFSNWRFVTSALTLKPRQGRVINRPVLIETRRRRRWRSKSNLPPLYLSVATPHVPKTHSTLIKRLFGISDPTK